MEAKKGIYDIAEICRFHGTETAILCPGSRCAPLTLAFSRTEGIRCESVVDERSAAFIALGIAETSGKPVVLVCTSGTAVLNFAPALAEAYYRRIPLLVFTADRPQRLVNQHDGQTMNQPNVYANFIRESFYVSGDIRHADELAFLHRTVNAAAIRAVAEGPVHVNISFEEPLYELAPAEQPPRFISALRHREAAESLLNGLASAHKKWLLLIGSRKASAAENERLARLAKYIPVSVEAISNAGLADAVPNGNEIVRSLSENREADFAPEVLITLGDGIVSKNLKKLIRKYKPRHHIHISPHSEPIDTYQCLSEVLAMEVTDALDALLTALKSPDTAFRDLWKSTSDAVQARTEAALAGLPFGDLKAMEVIAENLPADAWVHVANSMPVRYLNLFAFRLSEQTRVFCNRGTSGIDGSISTALGNAVGSGKPVWVITGDLSFQYDGNALWNHLPHANFRILILNNSGGGIFRLIDGPSAVPERGERFETRIQSSARFKAEQFGAQYFACDSEADLREAWPRFAGPGPNILEVFTDPQANETVFKSFQQLLSKTTI